jgi:hypothetical protein
MAVDGGRERQRRPRPAAPRAPRRPAVPAEVQLHQHRVPRRGQLQGDRLQLRRRELNRIAPEVQRLQNAVARRRGEPAQQRGGPGRPQLLPPMFRRSSRWLAASPAPSATPAAGPSPTAVRSSTVSGQPASASAPLRSSAPADLGPGAFTASGGQAKAWEGNQSTVSLWWSLQWIEDAQGLHVNPLNPRPLEPCSRQLVTSQVQPRQACVQRAARRPGDCLEHRRQPDGPDAVLRQVHLVGCAPIVASQDLPAALHQIRYTTRCRVS